jgi:hypothetical protein
MHQVTRPTLPLDDEEVDDLGRDQRDAVAQMWAARAESELRAGLAFTVVTRELVELGAQRELTKISARAIEEELHHSELCLRVAERYAGRSLPVPRASLGALPDDEVSDPSLRCALRLLGLCCVNESLACGWLAQSRDAARSRLARAAHRELLADEMDHARLGWAYLASDHVTAAHRTTLARRIGPLFRATLTLWTTQNVPRLPEGVPSHGLLPAAEARPFVLTSIREVVVPGLQHVGVDVRAAHEWLAREDAAVTAG